MNSLPFESSLSETALAAVQAYRDGDTPVDTVSMFTAPLRASCAACRDTGWLAEPEPWEPTTLVNAPYYPPPSIRAVPCSYCSIAEHKRRMRLLRTSQIPPGYDHATLGTFNATTDLTALALERARSWRNERDRDEAASTPGIYIYGPAGAGKTTLAIALLHDQMESPRVRSTQFWPVAELLDALRVSYRADGSTAPDLLESVVTTDVLVLDDLGVEKPTPWVLERLHILLNQRANYRRTTVFTSNLSTDELAEPLSARIVSRIIRMAYPFILYLDQPDQSFRRTL